MTKLKRHWTRCSEGFSYFKKLRHKQHTHYAQEFLEIMGNGIYDNKKPYLQTYIAAEMENLDNCRKNENRVKWNAKVNDLRAKMHALFITLRNDAKLGLNGAQLELDSYNCRVKGVTAQHEFVEGVRAFLGAWSGTSDSLTDDMVDDAQEIIEEIESLVAFMEMEDNMIANYPNQYVLREPTDELIFSIISKAQVEEYELSPTIESEMARLTDITKFLNAVDNWLKRVTIANKNSGSDSEDPDPQPDPQPEVLDELF